MSDKVSKSMRFDVFQRDGFTCQYCGRKPPQVVLNADHILAVKLGGKSAMDNLITACFDCNSGKSAKPMERVIAPLNFSVEERAEKLEQIAAYQKYLQNQTELMEGFIDHVVAAWGQRSGQRNDATEWVIPYGLVDAVRRFLRHLMPEEVIEAVHIAFDKYPHREAENEYRFKFFCGVCWRKIKQKENPEQKQL